MDMYRAEILDHFRNPHNEGKIEDADVVHEENNPLCGDVFTIYLKDNEIKFKAEGCAISKASMSMVTDHIKNMSKEEICKLNLEDVKNLLGISLTTSREKCAMIGLDGIKKVIEC